MTDLALLFLFITLIKTINVKKIRCVKFAEKFDGVDENVNLLSDSVEATEPEMPKPENGQGSIRRYPTRDRAKPKYLVDVYHKIPKMSPSMYEPLQI